MIRCKPLLGTYVEIAITESSSDIRSIKAMNAAFSAIEQVQKLMGFHDPKSELSRINAQSHLTSLDIHPWTTEVLRIAQELHKQSAGLFNCGIGHRLIEAGLLPRHVALSSHHFGGIEDIQWIESHLMYSKLPLCLDLGGIAKGFAVDKAVEALLESGISSGSVNAGGDMRVFGGMDHSIHVRNPASPKALIEIGVLQNGAIATSSLYFSQRDQQRKSYLVNPLNLAHIDFSESYSILAHECIYADALTKVVSLSGNTHHPCLGRYGAQAIRIAA